MTAQPVVPPAPALSLVPQTGPDGDGLARWVASAAEPVARARTCLDLPDVAVTREEVRSIERLARRVEGLLLTALAGAEAAGVAAKAGATDTGAWFADATGTDPAAAASQAGLAKSLDSGDLPATRRAPGEGELSAEHARIVVGAPDVARTRPCRDAPPGTVCQRSSTRCSRTAACSCRVGAVAA